MKYISNLIFLFLVALTYSCSSSCHDVPCRTSLDIEFQPVLQKPLMVTLTAEGEEFSCTMDASAQISCDEGLFLIVEDGEVAAISLADRAPRRVVLTIQNGGASAPEEYEVKPSYTTFEVTDKACGECEHANEKVDR